MRPIESVEHLDDIRMSLPQRLRCPEGVDLLSLGRWCRPTRHGSEQEEHTANSRTHTVLQASRGLLLGGHDPMMAKVIRGSNRAFRGEAR